MLTCKSRTFTYLSGIPSANGADDGTGDDGDGDGETHILRHFLTSQNKLQYHEI